MSIIVNRNKPAPKKIRRWYSKSKIDYLTQRREKQEWIRKNKMVAGHQEPIKLKDLARKATRPDSKGINHMVFLNHLSANRVVKKKAVNYGKNLF